MKEDFLTIPIVPDYEVNSELVVRNKKTKKILKSTRGTITLHKDGKAVAYRSPRSLRRLAMASSHGWYSIPSTNGRYEMTEKGEVRNAKTKHKLKPQRKKGRHGTWVRLHAGDKIFQTSINNLKWEVFGKIPKLSRFTPVGVTISKGGVTKHFKSLVYASKFLGEREHYSPRTAEAYLSERRQEIFGWAAKYHEPEDLRKKSDSTQKWLKGAFPKCPKSNCANISKSLLAK